MHSIALLRCIPGVFHGPSAGRGCPGQDVVKQNNVPILETGGPDSTITSAQRHQGDVLIAWGNEANLQYPCREEDQDIVDKNFYRQGVSTKTQAK